MKKRVLLLFVGVLLLMGCSAPPCKFDAAVTYLTTAGRMEGVAMYTAVRYLVCRNIQDEMKENDNRFETAEER